MYYQTTTILAESGNQFEKGCSHCRNVSKQ